MEPSSSTQATAPLPPPSPKPLLSSAQKPPSPRTPTGGTEWALVLAILVVVAGGVYYVSRPHATTTSGDTTLEAQDVATSSALGTTPHLSWAFAPAGGSGATGAPFVKVMLVVDGDSRDIGVFSGPCDVIGEGGSWTLAAGELTGVVCSFGESTEEAGVFYENGQYVVKTLMGETPATSGASFEPKFTL